MTAGLPDGGALSYECRGTATAGPPLLLLRPLGGSMSLWGEFAECLLQERWLIMFDPRGVGRSSDAPFWHSTRDMAADAVVLLDRLKVARAHIFGLSLGGMVASWLAVDAPERVDHLILASTLPRPRTISHRAFQGAASFLRGFARPGVEAEVSLVRRILSPQFRAAHPDRVRDIERAVRACPTNRRHLVQLALAAARHDAESVLPTVTAPALLLIGRLDPIAGARSQSDLLHDLPNAQLEVIDGAGHDLTLERPVATAERVLAFLRDLRPQPHAAPVAI